mgnify:CR=1 FL=1
MKVEIIGTRIPPCEGYEEDFSAVIAEWQRNSGVEDARIINATIVDRGADNLADRKSVV